MKTLEEYTCGYPLLYTSTKNEYLCNICAAAAEDDGESIVRKIYWEGPAVRCSQCRIHIKSAYGDPDEESKD